MDYCFIINIIHLSKNQVGCESVEGGKLVGFGVGQL